MRILILAGLLLCTVTAGASIRTETPPSPPRSESAVYTVTDKLDPDNFGEEQWRKEGEVIAIYSNGILVATIWSSEGGRKETTTTIGETFNTAFVFARPPRALPDKSRAEGSFVTIDRITRKMEASGMTADVHRVRDSVIIAYEVQGEGQIILYTLTYRNDSDLPQETEYIHLNNDKVVEHILKVRRN